MRLAKVAYVPVEKRAQICSVVKNASVALARERALGVVMRVAVTLGVRGGGGGAHADSTARPMANEGGGGGGVGE